MSVSVKYGGTVIQRQIVFVYGEMIVIIRCVEISITEIQLQGYSFAFVYGFKIGEISVVLI